MRNIPSRIAHSYDFIEPGLLCVYTEKSSPPPERNQGFANGGVGDRFKVCEHLNATEFLNNARLDRLRQKDGERLSNRNARRITQ